MQPNIPTTVLHTTAQPLERWMIQENLLKALVALVLFILAMGVIGFLFEEEMELATTWVVERIGFAGLGLILLVTDTLVTPFPPDILLLVIAKSRLSEDWLRYVLTLGVISVGAGMLGWAIGRWLGHFRFVKQMFGEFKQDHRDFIRRYGFWAVALGSVTPFPFSVTCWTAGVMGVRWLTVLLAAILFRIPRFVLYYWLIVTSRAWFGLG